MEEAAKTRRNKKDTLINISSDTFVRVVILLAVLLILSIVLTYVIPAGEFGRLENGETD